MSEIQTVGAFRVGGARNEFGNKQAMQMNVLAQSYVYCNITFKLWYWLEAAI